MVFRASSAASPRPLARLIHVSQTGLDVADKDLVLKVENTVLQARVTIAQASHCSSSVFAVPPETSSGPTASWTSELGSHST